MSKLTQICRSLFNRNNSDAGRYKAIVSEKSKFTDMDYKTCVFAQDQSDIVKNVSRRMKNSRAHKIEILDVFYQASRAEYFENACLTPGTQQDIEVFNKEHAGHDVNPGL